MGATIGTRLMTWWKGERVGQDQFGNIYYQEKAGAHKARRRRWVIYKGRPEASKVPADWHAWLHHTVAEPPRADAPHWTWEKPHLPNLTGTPHAYRPSGSLLEGGHRPQATGDYEAWRPE
jgi:NADH:ubiquinone oxidoreductase subunit